MEHSGGRGSYCLARILGMHTTCSMKWQREIETTFFDDLNPEEDVTFDSPAKPVPHLIGEPPFESEEEIRTRELIPLQLEATNTFYVPSLRILARQALEIPASVAAPAHVPSIQEPPKGLFDGVRPEVTNRLKGLLDYSFASAWHPDGRILVTGNQDTTCMLWDIRKTSESLTVLNGRMGAIKALKFSSDGWFLAMVEPVYFVHIFDAQFGFDKGQEIDLFGEIAGFSFRPNTKALFVGVVDRTYGSALEFSRKCRNAYMEAIY